MNLRIRLNHKERPFIQIIKGSSPHCSSRLRLICGPIMDMLVIFIFSDFILIEEYDASI